MLLGEFIRQYRLSHGNMSQDAFSRLSGISKGYISMLENNKNPRTKLPIAPTLDTFRKVAAAVGLTTNALMEIVDGDVDISHTTPAYLMGWDESADPAPSPADAVSFNSRETRLVELHRQLNNEGQEKLVDYADDLVSSGKYTKANLSGTDQKHGLHLEIKAAAESGMVDRIEYISEDDIKDLPDQGDELP